MKRTHWLTALVLAGALGSVANAAPERAGDFALPDHKGDIHQLSRYRHKDALVVYSQANNCGVTEAVAQLSELRAQWESQNIAFVLLLSLSRTVQALAVKVVSVHLQ